MSIRELTDFWRKGDRALALPRLTGTARMRAMAGVPEPERYAQGLSEAAAEWLEHVRAGRVGK